MKRANEAEVRALLQKRNHLVPIDGRIIVELQMQGLKYNPRMMLIQDADTPAIWYFRLKKEWLDAIGARRPFVNPVKEAVLRWRS